MHNLVAYSEFVKPTNVTGYEMEFSVPDYCILCSIFIFFYLSCPIPLLPGKVSVLSSQ